MALKNPQYNAIIRQYDQLQLANNRQLEERQQEIYKAIPAMSQTASIDLTKGASGFWPSHRGRVDFQFSKEHGGIFIQGSTGKAKIIPLRYTKGEAAV